MKRRILVFTAFIFFFLLLTFTLYSYGMDADSPFHFLRGQAYLDYILTGNRSILQPNIPSPVLFVPDQRISTFHMNAWEESSAALRKVGDLPTGTLQQLFREYESRHGRQTFYKHRAWSLSYYNGGLGGHPPVTDILLAATNKIFYEKLGLLADIEAYHFYVIITAILALLCVYFFTKKIFGQLAGILATVTLAFYPIFFAEAHFNIKDIPLLSYFTATLVSFYFWVATRKSRYFVSFAVFLFLGLGTKLNILFLPFIILPWLWSIRKTDVFKSWFNRRLFIYFIVFLIINSALITLLWPLFWDNPGQKLYGLFVFYKEVGSVDLRIQPTLPFTLPFGINILSIVLLITTTPLFTLLFLITGLISTFRLTEKERILILLWFFVPLLRVIALSADIFGSTRQYIEFLPALSILAGIGGTKIINLTGKYAKTKHQLVLFSVSAIYLTSLLWINFSLHPNQNVYFNFLSGGMKGAWKKDIYDWKTSLTNPYRQAVNWLNKYAEKKARLAFLDGTMTAISPLWLRDDISFGSFFSGLDRQGEFIISLTYPKPPATFGYLYLERFLKPVHEIKAGEISLAKIWKNDNPYVRREYSQVVSLEEKFDQIRGTDKQGDYWEVDLGREYKLVSLTMQSPADNCQNKDGLFKLKDYFIPYRIDTSDDTSVFYFPAVETRILRFYSLVPYTCLFGANILDISVISK